MTAINDAPVFDLDGSTGGIDFTTSFTENAGAVGIVDTDATLIDVDDTNIESATITITNLLDGTDEVLAATTAGTSITASYDAGVLTLTGSDTKANYLTVLKSVTYNNASEDPTTTTRTIDFVINDGTDTSSVATTTVSMTAINDAPVFDLDSSTGGLDFTTSFTENAGAVDIVDTDATLIDVDDTNIESATVTITNLLDGTDEVLAATTTGTSITASYDSGVLTLTGSDTKANYLTVLKTITYNNASEDPSTTTRTIDFLINDGTDLSSVATTTVSMTAINDAPVFDLDGSTGGIDFTTSFTENAGAVSIVDTDATLIDVDDTNIESATVTITNLLDGTDEVLAATTTGTSITASYDSGVLTLTGSDTKANYLTVLKSITYNNASEDPTTTTRTIDFVINDGTDLSSIATTTVSMTAINDAPVFDLDGSTGGIDFTTSFTENAGAVGIVDTDATLS